MILNFDKMQVIREVTIGPCNHSSQNENLQEFLLSVHVTSKQKISKVQCNILLSLTLGT